MRNEFTAVIERDGDWYVAYCPEIPGANGQGRSKDEARENLAEAIENYAEAAKVGVERAVRELQELRRQASSSIVLPGAGSAAGLTGTLPPGGLGGGKIKLP